jgi:predicted HNH restriction endonuclease
VQELSSLSSINGVKLIKKFDANNVHKSNYLRQTLTDDGSSAVYEIVDNGRRYKGLLKFLSGFEEIESKTNAGIWTNSNKSVFNIVDHRTDSVTNNMSIDFSMTLSSIRLNSVTIKQKDEVLWNGKVDQSPVNIAFNAKFNIPIEIYQSNLFVPNQINSESKDYRSLGIFISDYTDALC